MNDLQQKQLGATLWAIADKLRGAMIRASAAGRLSLCDSAPRPPDIPLRSGGCSRSPRRSAGAPPWRGCPESWTPPYPEQETCPPPDPAGSRRDTAGSSAPPARTEAFRLPRCRRPGTRCRAGWRSWTARSPPCEPRSPVRPRRAQTVRRSQPRCKPRSPVRPRCSQTVRRSQPGGETGVAVQTGPTETLRQDHPGGKPGADGRADSSRIVYTESSPLPETLRSAGRSTDIPPALPIGAPRIRSSQTLPPQPSGEKGQGLLPKEGRELTKTAAAPQAAHRRILQSKINSRSSVRPSRSGGLPFRVRGPWATDCGNTLPAEMRSK